MASIATTWVATVKRKLCRCFDVFVQYGEDFSLIIVLAFTTNPNLLAGFKIPGIVAKTKPAVALVKTWDSKGNLLTSRTGSISRGWPVGGWLPRGAKL